MEDNQSTKGEQPLAYEEEPAKTPPEEPEPPDPPAVDPDGGMKSRRGGAPPWVHLPEGLRMPRYRQAGFIRFPSAWTHAPNVGRPLRAEDEGSRKAAGEGKLWRQVIIWPLTIGDMKLAIGRSMQDPNRYQDELAKQMIRAVDGHAADWTGIPSPGSVDQLWEQLGSGCRSILRQIYGQLHNLSREQLSLFFASCIEFRTTD